MVTMAMMSVAVDATRGIDKSDIPLAVIAVFFSGLMLILYPITRWMETRDIHQGDLYGASSWRTMRVTFCSALATLTVLALGVIWIV